MGVLKNLENSSGFSGLKIYKIKLTPKREVRDGGQMFFFVTLEIYMIALGLFLPLKHKSHKHMAVCAGALLGLDI